jgi:hypothetical protein
MGTFRTRQPRQPMSDLLRASPPKGYVSTLARGYCSQALNASANTRSPGVPLSSWQKASDIRQGDIGHAFLEGLHLVFEEHVHCARVSTHSKNRLFHLVSAASGAAFVAEPAM